MKWNGINAWTYKGYGIQVDKEGMFEAYEQVRSEPRTAVHPVMTYGEQVAVADTMKELKRAIDKLTTEE